MAEVESETISKSPQLPKMQPRWRSKKNQSIRRLSAHLVGHQKGINKIKNSDGKKQQTERFRKREPRMHPPPPIDTQQASRLEIAMRSDIAELQGRRDEDHDKVEVLVYGLNRHDLIRRFRYPRLAEPRKNSPTRHTKSSDSQALKDLETST